MRITFLTATLLLIFSSINSQDLGGKKNFKNNLTIKPFNGTSTGLGMALQFEHYFDQKNNFSLVLPVGVAFSVTNENTSNLDDQIGIDFNPTLRFYFLEPKRFNWYLGSSIFYGYGRSTPYNSNSYSSVQTALGPMVHVGFKGTIQDRFTYQLDFGNGYKIHNKITYENPSLPSGFYSKPSNYLGSFSAGFGYSF